MDKKYIYQVSAAIILIGVIYALYFTNYISVPELSEAERQRDAQIAADILLLQQIDTTRRIKEANDNLQKDYASEIAALDEIIERNANGNKTQSDIQSGAKVQKGIMLQQSELNYSASVSRDNFIASFHGMFDIFTSTTSSLAAKMIALSQILVGIQQSCECYHWVVEAAETYGDGSFMKKYGADDFTVTMNTKWRDDRYLGVYMLPFTVKQLTEEDVFWQNGHYKALSIMHAMINELPTTDPYLVAWDMEYLIHSLDRVDLNDDARARIIAEIAEKYHYLDENTLLFRETRYHALMLKAYQSAIKYSLSVYLPETYSFDAAEGLDAIDAAITTARGIVERGDGDIIYQESIIGFLQLYYAYLADTTGVYRERVPEMLARFDIPETLQASQGLYLFFTLPHWQDALRSFVLDYAETNESTRTTLEGLGWSFSK